MTEKYTNLGASSLNGSINAAITAITITDGVTTFPATAQFRIIIESEIMIVTAGAASNNWTVTRGAEGTIAASHSSGALVKEVLTKGALDQIRADISQQGVIGNRPTAEKAGIMYNSTDYPFLSRDTGSGWQTFGPIYACTHPQKSDFTITNQGANTVTDSNAGIFLQITSTASDFWLLLTKPVPATPYTVTVGFLPCFYPNNYVNAGVVLYDSVSGKFVVNGFIANTTSNPLYHLQVKYNSVTNYNSDYSGTGRVTVMNPGGMVLFALQDDGTNRNFLLTTDGVNYVTLFSVGNTDFVTPNRVGFGFGCNGTAGKQFNLLVPHFAGA